MARFSLTPYLPEHALTLWDKGTRQTVSTMDREAVEQRAVRHATDGVGFTLLKDETIVGCGGVDINGPAGEAWVLFSPEVTRYAKTALRVVRTTIEAIMNQNGLKEVYAQINAKDVAAQAWVHVLGFVYQPSIPGREAIDGNTYLTYRRAR